MLILFAFILMRMSGAIVFNPVFGRTNYPSSAKAALILVLSLLLYLGIEEPVKQPSSLVEFAVKLLMELLVGFILGLIGVLIMIPFIVLRWLVYLPSSILSDIWEC